VSKPKEAKVMREFKKGTLKSGSGAKVTSRKQAIAIALSEAGKSKKKPAKLPSKPKKMNALDKAIMKQKQLKSKNKNPGRYLDK